MQQDGMDGNYRSPVSSPLKERSSPVADENNAVLQREIEALKREKSQLNAQLSAAHSDQRQLKLQVKNLEDQVIEKKDVERELAEMKEYAMDLKNKVDNGGDMQGAMPDEEYDKLKQRFNDN